jgi:EmrB/QacA subfamily drug resistance transporter
VSVMSAPTTTTTITPPAQRHHLALAIIVTCQLMLIIDATVMNVALPHIQADLHLSTAGLTWVMTSYTLAFGGLLLLGGRAGDVFGRRRMFVGGIVLFTVASLLGGLAPSAGWLLAARALQGVGAAAAGPSTIALITTTFTETRERIRALALFSAASGAGFALGLIVGGAVTEAASWRWVLFINVPFGIAAAALAPRFVAEPPRHAGRLDLPGALAATTGMLSLVYGLLSATSHGWSSPVTIITIALGIVLIGCFISIEARVRQPLMPLRLFGDRDRAAGYLGFALGPMAMMSTFFLLTQFVQDDRGYSPLRTGLAFLPLALAMLTMSRVVPRILPRTGARPLVMAGASMMTGGLIWLTQLHGGSAYATGILGPMVLMGLGGGLAFIAMPPTIFATVPPQDAGAAGGVLQTMQQTGATLGISVIAAVAAGTGGSLVAGMTNAFAVAAGIAAVIVVVVGPLFRSRVPAGS